MKGFKQGGVQTNLLIETDKKKIVFRCYENRSKEYVLFEVNVLNYLRKHSYPCPPPIKDIRGNFIGEYKNKPFVILKFMKGKHKKNVDNKLIARVIGRLHKITFRYKPRFHKTRDSYNPITCWNSAVTSSKKITSKKKAKNRLKWLRSELKKLNLPNNMPKGVCHCDTHPSNFLYENHKISTVLDFDDAGYTWLLYDIANMIYYWAWPHKKQINFKKAKELIKEYTRFRKLTEIEKKHLYDILKIVILMSIGWFIDDNEDYFWEKKKIESLNSFNRKSFYSQIFSGEKLTL